MMRLARSLSPEKICADMWAALPRIAHAACACSLRPYPLGHSRPHRLLSDPGGGTRLPTSRRPPPNSAVLCRPRPDPQDQRRRGTRVLDPSIRFRSPLTRSAHASDTLLAEGCRLEIASSRWTEQPGRRRRPARLGAVGAWDGAWFWRAGCRICVGALGRWHGDGGVQAEEIRRGCPSSLVVSSSVRSSPTGFLVAKLSWLISLCQILSQTSR